ncbi:hypothetical protein P154DRAFT_167657 [Amniculicola lignicola CBS 123094]|uniref:Uncharacterized protein n=1 Tax=Amniculicola lignicola CBS 123094 TaxID=1392246 RepID=A0A6A5W518_9PLEO|nr:hypothetical protein P154DRAFT_167657 [Amniculicola lignicola CBS 123094]
MLTLSKFTALAVLLLSPTLATVEAGCDCFTATSYISADACAFNPRPCIVPLCLFISTTTIPGSHPKCPKTPTVTSTIPCATACPRGCGTYTTTETASAACLTTGAPPKQTKSATATITRIVPTVGPYPTKFPSRWEA